MSLNATNHSREKPMELFASAPGLAVEESYVRLLNPLPGLAYRCRVGRTDPIVSERLEYTLEFVSKGSYDLLGIPAEDMVRNNNNTIERMMHPDDLQKTRRNMYDSIVAHQPYQVMYRVSLPSGRLKWISGRGGFRRRRRTALPRRADDGHQRTEVPRA